MSAIAVTPEPEPEPEPEPPVNWSSKSFLILTWIERNSLNKNMITC